MKLKLVLFIFTFSLPTFAVRNGMPTHHPALALLKFSKGRVCTGTRISKDYIISAAHCFKASSKRYRIQYYNAGKLIKAKMLTKFVKIKSRKFYEEYALIKTLPNPEEPFPEEIMPVKALSLTDFHINNVLKIYGFGHTGNGNLGTLRSGELEFSSTYVEKNDSKQMLVMRPTNTDHLPCPGDSGGPLIYTDELGKEFMVGNVSFISNSDINVAKSLQGVDEIQQCLLSNRAYYLSIKENLDILKPFVPDLIKVEAQPIAEDKANDETINEIESSETETEVETEADTNTETNPQQNELQTQQDSQKTDPQQTL
jgi:hypothetical protein